MKRRKIGKSNLEVSEISFGCWTMGGLNWVNGSPNGWANVDEDEIIRAIKIGLDAGVNHFDNADVYGNGRAERMLARAFKKLGVKSTDYIVASKIGHFPGTAEHAYEPAHIRHQCEQSLINLQRDYIDIYYFHHGDFGPGRRYLPAAAETMNQLVKEGKVRVKGLSAYNIEDFEEVVPVVKPEALQSWANALDDRFVQPGSRLVKLMDQHDLTFVAFSPLAQGILLDKYDPAKPPAFESGDNRKDHQAFGAENLKRLKPKLEKLKARFGSSTETLAATALNYILAQPRVACVIPGFRNENQARCNLGATKQELTPEDIRFIRDTLA
ncbi:MAG: aldo/keto reductase [Methylacidiphilales bacterium]|nr:aldo/keto reductase [Candidatus Methylacidiphilales bacterium]